MKISCFFYYWNVYFLFLANIIFNNKRVKLLTNLERNQLLDNKLIVEDGKKYIKNC